jgi:hypothetical protein
VCLWKYGFDENSEDAKAFGVSLPGAKRYVLAKMDGTVIGVVDAVKPPAKYQHVIDTPLK